MPCILLIDDEPDLLLAFVRHIVKDSGIQIEVARTGDDGVRAVAAFHPDVVLLDLNLPDRSGLEVYRLLRHVDARCPVIFITGSNMTEHAIEAMKQGAFDYLFKPVDREQLRRVLEQGLELSRLMKEPALATGELPADQNSNVLIGRSSAMAEVYKAIGRVASQKVIVLILGESGTGKELVPRAIYQHSRRADKPFLAINCAAIPENLLESELFGHERGAFTGADGAASANSSSATAVPCFSMKSAHGPCRRRPKCSASCRNSASSGSAAMRPCPPTFALLRPPIAI